MKYELHVEQATRLYEALAKGERETLAELLSPAFRGRTTDGLPLDLGGTYNSADSMQRDFWWRIGRHFRVQAHPEDFHGLDDGRLQVAGRYIGEGRESRRPLDAVFIHVLTFDEQGRVTALDQHTDSAAWVDALGERLETINYSVEQGVATICLDRPDRLNAIDRQVAQEFLTVVRRIAADASVRAVLICGEGPSLTVGGDIEYFRDHGEAGAYGDLLRSMTTPFHDAFRILSNIDAPIVTAAHGAVAGGGLGFLWAADLVVASEDFRLVTAFAGVGVSGDGGGTWHLPRLVGARKAAQLYLLNEPLDATEALELGILSEVVPNGDVRDRALVLARRLASGPTVAYGGMRRLLRDSFTNTLTDHLQAETDTIGRTGNSSDTAEAVAAFLAKRRPTFEGI
jgi:2-(1,2-epoxy-1,2-dihydrophenyl)acetyl-CoA isomerase